MLRDIRMSQILASFTISAATTQDSSTDTSGGRKRTTQHTSFAEYSDSHVRRSRWQLAFAAPTPAVRVAAFICFTCQLDAPTYFP